MRYIIKSGTELFSALWEFNHKINAIQKDCFALAKELGSESSQIAFVKGSAAGGITGFNFPEKPEGWKLTCEQNFESYYFPKQSKVNQPLIDRIQAIPLVMKDEINTLIGFKSQWSGLSYMRYVGVIWQPDFILIQIPEEADYSPAAGMEEITVSEHKRLSQAATAEVATPNS
ncbi:hypothetical protein [Larkinella punicea]|uniref:Uncharacterized protein n=1 Tax=Larkinella punicea TaxID=2315727 RepID=A0A368JP82_9BACT|nr:hypothetical protein [Larkinella punicea]RCR69438.1 hypothetical protein DUE52_11335 [Larkinella punicea]